MNDYMTKTELRVKVNELESANNRLKLQVSELGNAKYRAEMVDQQAHRLQHAIELERAKFNGYQQAVRDVVEKLPIRPDPCGGC